VRRRRAGILGVVAALGLWGGAWWYARSPSAVEPLTLASGTHRLDATLYSRPGSTSFIVFCHGNRRDGRRHPLYRRLLKGLSRDHNILAFDFRGYGRSTALPPYAKGFTFDFHEDVAAASDYLSRRFSVDPAEIVLMGHSLGSLQILNASKHLPSRRLVALGPTNFERIRDNPDAADFHVKKIRRNTGVEIPVKDLTAVFGYWRTDRLLTGLQAEKIVVIYGGEEPAGERLEAATGTFGKWPEGRAAVHEIAGANHMYGSESPGFWTRDIRSRVWIGQLVRRINSELNRNIHE
jgi:pimeloyl-ACP methyl ester carboxylesterase